MDLLKTEIHKFINRPWVYIILLLIPINLIFYGFVELDNDVKKNAWRDELVKENEEILIEISELDQEDPYNEFLESKIERNELYLKNDVSPLYIDNWTFAIETDFFNLFLMLLVVSLSCVSFSSERFLGTLPNLFLNGYTFLRLTISKLIVLISFLIITSFIFLILRLLFGGILYGFTNPSATVYVYESGGYLSSMNSIVYLTIIHLSFIVETLILIILSCLFSSFFKNWILPMVIVLGLTGLAPTILGFVSENMLVKLSIFSNMNLSVFILGGDRLITGYNLYTAILIITIHITVIIVALIYRMKKMQHIN